MSQFSAYQSVKVRKANEGEDLARAGEVGAFLRTVPTFGDQPEQAEVKFEDATVLVKTADLSPL